MSSETRVFRPFNLPAGLERALDETLFVVGEHRYANGASVSLTHDRYVMSPVGVELARTDEDFNLWLSELRAQCAAADLSEDDVRLVAIVETHYLKISDVAYSSPVAKLSPADRVLSLTADCRPRALSTPHAGAKILLYLLVGEEQPKAVLRPWRKGTWLAKATMRLRTDLAASGFVPRPLTDHVREQFGLQPDSVKYITFDQSVLDPDVGDDSVELYVDEELLAHMSASPGSSHARILQLQLFTNVIEAMVDAASREPDYEHVGIDEIEGSLLYRAVELAAGRVANESQSSRRERLADVFDELRSSRQLFMSRIEAQCGLLRELKKAVSDD